jgi:hypothetical protein
MARSRCCRSVAGESPASPRVFLDIDDRLSLAELGRQPPGFSRKPLVFGDQGGVGIGLPPTTLGRQSGKRPFVTLLPPRTQERRVQSFAA